jgi:hypothetical protein
MPIPLLVASPRTRRDEVDRLRDVLVQAGDEPALAPAREAVLLRRFAPVDAGDYDILREPAGKALV